MRRSTAGRVHTSKRLDTIVETADTSVRATKPKLALMGQLAELRRAPRITDVNAAPPAHLTPDRPHAPDYRLRYSVRFASGNSGSGDQLDNNRLPGAGRSLRSDIEQKRQGQQLQRRDDIREPFRASLVPIANSMERLVPVNRA
jgi:hypothetical protein